MSITIRHHNVFLPVLRSHQTASRVKMQPFAQSVSQVILFLTISHHCALLSVTFRTATFANQVLRAPHVHRDTP